MNLTDLDTFLRVAGTGSFTKAAAELGVPKSTVSRRVARLEEALGVELLARKARSFTFTEHGRFLQARCGPALEEIDSVERALAELSGEPAGMLRITTNNDMGKSPMFTRLIADFRDAWPKVELDVELTSRHVDLIEEGFDVAFRAHGRPLPDSTALMTRRLQAGTAGVFASPGYVDEHGPITSPRALARHDCLTLRPGRLLDTWALRRGPGAKAAEYPIRRVLSSNDFSLLVIAAVEGMGVALLPAFFADPLVAEGRLVRVLPRWELPVGTFSLVWQRSRYPSPRVRAFVDAASEAFG